MSVVAPGAASPPAPRSKAKRNAPFSRRIAIGKRLAGTRPTPIVLRASTNPNVNGATAPGIKRVLAFEEVRLSTGQRLPSGHGAANSQAAPCHQPCPRRREGLRRCAHVGRANSGPIGLARIVRCRPRASRCELSSLPTSLGGVAAAGHCFAAGAEPARGHALGSVRWAVELRTKGRHLFGPSLAARVWLIRPSR